MAARVGQQLGNYRLLRVLGQGAFAEVYLAEHLYLERLAAIKILHVQMDPEAQERFCREARTIAHLQHPHIVQVLEFGINDQTPYLVMEYTSGGTLRSHHPKGTRLPVEQIMVYVKQIAAALDYAHQQRVIHRDVKPENLLLNANHEVVLSDFGLAVMQRTLDSLSTQDPAGTPLYMAPEQLQQHPCAASDQYALGILVYEWLAGEAPFRGTLFEVFSHHLYQLPPSLRERLPDLPVAVEEAVFKVLAKNPEQRFACVADFASALEEACDTTQPLTLHELPKQRTQEPTVSPSTLFVRTAIAREQEGSSSSMHPLPMPVQPRGRGQEGVSLIAPGAVLHPQSVSKVVKPSLAQSNRQQVFEHYVERLLTRRGAETRFLPQKTRYWLSWLARQLAQHSQTEFYLEQMQSDWLPEYLQHRRSYRTTVRMIIALFIGLLYGILSGLAFGLPFGLRSGLVYGTVIGLEQAHLSDPKRRNLAFCTERCTSWIDWCICQ